MKYFYYMLDIDKNRVQLDEEIKLPLDKLGWSEGDRFELKTINGVTEFVKVED